MSQLISVSNYGRVRCAKTNRVKIGTKRNDGYVSISLFKKMWLMHRLVGTAFVSGRSEIKNTIDHIDYDKSNNHSKNLQWLSTKEQNKRSATRAKILHQNKIVKTGMSRRILAKLKTETEWTIYSSISALQKVVKISHKNLCKRLSGEKTNSKEMYDFKEERYEPLLIPGEVWKEVILDGKKTIYNISNFGRLKGAKNLITRGSKKADGYCYTTVDGNGYSMHFLVANAFLPPKTHEKYTIDHVDNDKTNNNARNLEWISQSEQLRRRFAFAKKKGKKNDVRGMPIESAIVGTNVWEKFLSINIASRHLSIGRSDIMRCLKGIRGRKTAKGRIFRYVCVQSQNSLKGEKWKTIDLSKESHETEKDKKIEILPVNLQIVEEKTTKKRRLPNGENNKPQKKHKTF